MRKPLALLVLMLVVCNMAQSQTLFTYGNRSVTKEEFLKAFNKNPSLEPDRKKALREYLQLYINFKLKVQAAYDNNLQNDPNYQYETANFKKQLATNFINDEANIKALVDEAFRRSQKDIHLQQVFIEVPAGKDTADAYARIQKAYFDLRAGKSFNEVALLVNPAAKDLGYITVFSLPYTYENIVYSLKPGSYAAPVHSSAGYHIFYNAAERQALGRRKAAQILFAVAPGASAADKQVIKSKADSVRKVLIKDPGEWNAMVQAFSNDVTTADKDGVMKEFGIGEFNPEFEAAAYALKKSGEISLPVETNYGYHIIRLIEIIAVPKNMEDPVIAAGFREKVEKDDRLTEARKLLVNKWMKLANYKAVPFDAQELWAYTDSFFAGGDTKKIKKIGDSTVIFTFAKQKITASDFAKYNRAVKAFPMYQSMAYPDIMKEYIKAATSDYYQAHLEDYNTDFKAQLREYNDANLLFAIMDKEVWNKAINDEQGLRETYERNRHKYMWGPSANAVIFTAKNESVLKALQQKLIGHEADWKTISENFGNDVMADSSRYELGQIPVVDRTNFTDKLTTAPVKNADGSYTFAHIVKVYNQEMQRSFEEARGIVTNDYQSLLEQEWMASLKKKYPVKVNEAVFNSIK